MRQIRQHLNYSNIISTLALIVVLGTGTAFAANQLAPKSVGTTQLRPGAVTADKLRKNAVTASKIESLAVKQGKIASGAVTSAKVANGAITSEKIPGGAVTPDKIPDDSLTGAKIQEATLSQVPSANTANTATFATSSNPEAFAQVSKEAAVITANSKGIGPADVKQGKEPGIYCINVPGFVPKGALATAEKTETLDTDVSVFVKFGGTVSCPYPQVEVQTYNNGGRTKEPFYFMAYR